MGGAFILKSICKDCNELMGENIDKPLLQSPRISFYRHKFQIKRKGVKSRGNIPNPFKGKHFDEYGNPHVLIFNEKGEPRAKMIPRISDPHTSKDGELKITYSMSKEDFTNEEDVKKLLSKKLNIDLDDARIEYEESEPTEPLNFMANVPNNPLIFGCVKIGYEMAATFAPEFLDDPRSHKFSEILMSPSTFEKHTELFEPLSQIPEELVEKIKQIEKAHLKQHVVLLSPAKELGLICVIKLFDFMFILKLTDNQTPLLLNDVILINDAVAQEYQVFLTSVLSSFTLKPDLTSLSREMRRKLIKLNASAFKQKDGKIPIFDKSGIKLFDNLDLLIKKSKLLQYKYDIYKKKAELTYSIDNQMYFLYAANHSLMLPLSEVTCHYDLKY